MSLTALVMLVAAGALHAAWNLLLKQTHERYIVMWWALYVGSVAFLPLLLFARPPTASSWSYVVASACLESAYFIMLAAAYGAGDFSLVYPIARGAAPALLAAWATVFLGERPTTAGVIGLLILVLGLMVIGSSAWWSAGRQRNADVRSLALALGVALCISGYSAIDGAAVQLVSPSSYTVLVFGLTAGLITPVVGTQYGLPALLRIGRRDWWRIGIIGLLMIVSYMLVLSVYAIAPVSYAGAVREVSIVFAALAGWHWLDEPFGAGRTAGALLVFGGILVIAIMS